MFFLVCFLPASCATDSATITRATGFFLSAPAMSMSSSEPCYFFPFFVYHLIFLLGCSFCQNVFCFALFNFIVWDLDKTVDCFAFRTFCWRVCTVLDVSAFAFPDNSFSSHYSDSPDSFLLSFILGLKYILLA